MLEVCLVWGLHLVALGFFLSLVLWDQTRVNRVQGRYPPCCPPTSALDMMNSKNHPHLAFEMEMGWSGTAWDLRRPASVFLWD